MATIQEVAAQLMEHLCSHSWHGYTQGNRWGDGGTETLVIDGKSYTIASGDRDCSSAVISVYKAAIVNTPYEGLLDGATYTGDMYSVFINSGLFEAHDLSFTAQRGDIYLTPYAHTAMCTSASPDLLGEFRISENGTVYGEVGDQTGDESLVHGYYDYPWDCILHYIGTGDGEGDNDNDEPVEPAEIPDIRYRVSTDPTGAEWLPEMINHVDTGGSTDTFGGNGDSIYFIAVDMPGWYKVCTQASGWLDPVRGYDIHDLNKGCGGDGSPITAFVAYYETQNPRATGWLGVEYSVTGLDAETITKVQMKLVRI